MTSSVVYVVVAIYLFNRSIYKRLLLQSILMIEINNNSMHNKFLSDIFQHNCWYLCARLNLNINFDREKDSSYYILYVKQKKSFFPCHKHKTFTKIWIYS